MVKSNRENEIKLAFPSPETAVRRLLDAGAREVHARSFEDNFVFDLARLPLTKGGRLLRLREYDGASTLTFKAPVLGEHRHKVRTEHETAVAEPDALRSILHALGFEVVYRYQKYRATYALDEVVAALDETSLGTFVELEGAPDDVDRAAAALGALPHEFIRATYRELQEKDAAARGVVAGDMLLAPPERPGIRRMKAMLLAAGYGERMLPITRVVPKPLIPVLGRPLAPQILSRLGAEGIDEAVINLHHLPQTLRDAFGDGAAIGLRALHYSLEEEQLLGTGGGLAHAAAQLKGAGTILVRNSDFLADIPLSKAIASHLRSGCPATIVLAPHRAGYTPVAIDDRHRVVAFGGGRGGRYLFTGYHLIEESVLDLIPRGAPSDIVRDVYFGLAADGRLNAHVHAGFWWEFGHPREYLEGSMRLVALPAEGRMRLGDFDVVRSAGGAVAAIGAGADITAPGIQLAGTLAIGMGVMIGEGATLEDTVVMPEAWVGPGSSLLRCIVGPGTEIPLGFSASNALLATDVDRRAALTGGIERVAGILVRRFSDSPTS